MKKGFTLVELLAAILILGIILAISLPTIFNIIDNVKVNAHIKNEGMLLRAAKNYIVENEHDLPIDVGDTFEVRLSELKSRNYIDNIKKPGGNNECDGYVTITKIGNNKYDYTPFINCLTDAGSSSDDALILYYKFDDYQEATINLIPNSPINSYPKLGNTHGTYNTNQYNSNNFFSIGTVGSVANNIVTLSSVGRAIHTYDVLTPETSGGGVTAGVNYFIKKHSDNSFSLHTYNSSQDGSLGFQVHNSVNNDIRIPINGTNFPTMWHGRPHLPNSALVKEIISDCFNQNGVSHECIRLHTNHKPQGDVDGMAYSVNPQVVQGRTYTFSFYYRAANEASIGTNIHLNLHTGATWPGSGSSRPVNSMEWVRYELTTVAPNTGGTSLYFWPTKGAVIDITEIQCEEKPYATPFTETERVGFIKDYSFNSNHSTIYMGTTPKWVTDSKVGTGAYQFNGSSEISVNNSYNPSHISPILLGTNPSTTNNFNGNATYMAWVKPTTLDGVARHVFTDNNYNEGEIEFYNNRIRAYFGDGNEIIYYTTVQAGRWYHIAMTHERDNGSNLYRFNLYLDGVVIGTNSRLISSSDSTYGPDNRLVIGYNWIGLIDDVIIYNRLLSDLEIRHRYDLGNHK